MLWSGSAAEKSQEIAIEWGMLLHKASVLLNCTCLHKSVLLEVEKVLESEVLFLLLFLKNQ